MLGQRLCYVYTLLSPHSCDGCCCRCGCRRLRRVCRWIPGRPSVAQETQTNVAAPLASPHDFAPFTSPCGLIVRSPATPFSSGCYAVWRLQLSSFSSAVVYTIHLGHSPGYLRLAPPRSLCTVPWAVLAPALRLFSFNRVRMWCHSLRSTRWSHLTMFQPLLRFIDLCAMYVVFRQKNKHPSKIN